MFQNCVSSAIHGNKARYLREREVAMLKRTKRTVLRVMFGVNLINRKNTNELRQMLVVTVPIKKMVRTAAARWNSRHVLQRKKGNILKQELNFEVLKRRKRKKRKAT